MVVAVGVLAVTSVLLAGTFVAINGDSGLGQTDLNGKEAYNAALAIGASGVLLAVKGG